MRSIRCPDKMKASRIRGKLVLFRFEIDREGNKTNGARKRNPSNFPVFIAAYKKKGKEKEISSSSSV